MSDMIGANGNDMNNGIASSAVNRDADIERIKKYDEYDKEWKPRFSKWMSVFISIGILLVKKYNLLLGMVVILLPLIWFFFRKIIYKRIYVSPMEIYKNGLITPAIITKIDNNGIELLHLAPMRNTVYSEMILGCKKKKIKELPETNLKVGEIIPCVSVFYPERKVKNCWGDFVSRPLTWGFKDKQIIHSAMVALLLDEDYPEDYGSTLKKLSIIMDKKTSDTLIYFDEYLNIVYDSSEKNLSDMPIFH